MVIVLGIVEGILIGKVVVIVVGIFLGIVVGISIGNVVVIVVGIVVGIVVTIIFSIHCFVIGSASYPS